MKAVFFFLFLTAALSVSCEGLDDNAIRHHAYKREISELVQKSKTVLKLQDPIEQKVFFYLYTRKNVDDPLPLIPNDSLYLNSSYFDVNKPTKILIHGFFGTIKRRMVQELKRRFLEVEDVNIIAVDWSSIAWNVNYLEIVQDIPSIGRFLAEMLDFLIVEGCEAKTIHLLGHSLGAHVAGYAGQYINKGRIGRITGLDPAKPMFHLVDRSQRLDSGDADFVDCIHTCAGLLGLAEPIGHVDFYPNGGKNVQPGCYYIDFGRCSHRRSYEYFAESILPTHKFPALVCDEFNENLENCTDSDVYMGNYVNQSVRGTFFVHTNRDFPYAINS